MERKRMFIIGFIGFLSGLISFLLSHLATQYFLIIAPGIVWALAILYLSNKYWSFHTNKQMVALWVAVSALAHFLAVTIAIVLGVYLSMSVLISMPIAGIIGAAIMLAGFRSAICKIELRYLFALSVLSGVLALSYYLGIIDVPFTDALEELIDSTISIDLDNFGDSLYSFYWASRTGNLFLYLVWQTGMTLGLVFLVNSAKQTSVQEIPQSSV